MRRRDMNAAVTVFGLALVAFAASGSAQVPSAPTPQHLEQDTKLQSGANSFAESQARDLLEQQGYSNVSPLMNDKNGIWHGKAVKDHKAFDVSVDYLGHVAAK